MDYNWELGELVKENSKTYRISCHHHGYERVVPKEKCAFPDESVCIVWEIWKGVNGRGGYRVERELYPNRRVKARKISRQSGGIGRITELTYGECQEDEYERAYSERQAR
jgi:hypothetical protein